MIVLGEMLMVLLVRQNYCNGLRYCKEGCGAPSWKQELVSFITIIHPLTFLVI